MRLEEDSINGLDTETINGYCKIIANQNEYRLVNSFDEIFDFIKNFKYFTYNLRYDAEGILKYLSQENLREAIMNKKIMWSYKDYKILYIPNKMLSISKRIDGHKNITRVTVYDLAQFCNLLPLDDAAKLNGFGGKQKNPTIENFKRHQNDWNLNEYLKLNLSVIGEYCKDDAGLVFKIANKQKELLKKLFNIELMKPTSKACIFTEILTQRKIEYPRGINHHDKDSYHYAELAFKGGIFSTLRKGTFENLQDFDIQSAYPNEMVKLENLLNGKIVPINDEKFINDFKYGWIRVKHNCEYFPVKSDNYNKADFVINNKHVIVHFPDSYLVVYPEGYRYDYITLLEYNFLKKWGYDVLFLDGYGWVQTTDTAKKPFGFIQEMFDERMKYPKKTYPIENSLLKIGMNGGYGKLVQKIGNPVWQNFYYGSYITANTRCQVIDFIKENNIENNVVSIATDGILTEGITKPLKGDFTPEKLGAWEIKNYKEGLILGNGVYELDGTVKFRGFHTKESIRNILQHKRLANTVIIKMKKVVHLTEAIRHNKIYSKEDINKFIIEGKIIRVNSDQTTMKWQKFNNFGELLDGQYTGKRFNIKEVRPYI